MPIKKLLHEWKSVLIFAPLILGLGIFLRTYKLDTIPVFVDEAIYVRWAQVMKAESTLRFLPLSDGKQPLFMWSIIPALGVINDPLIAGRLVSVAAGVGSIVGVFAIAQVLFNDKRVSLFSSFIYTMSPFTVFFDRMALADSTLTFFGIWTLFFAILTAKYERLDTAMLAGFALGGASLTKSPALFFALLLPSTIVVFDWDKKKNRPLRLIKLVGLWAITWGLAFGFYNILRLGPNFHMISLRNNDYVFPISHIWENPRDPFMPHFDRGLEWIQMLGPSTIIFLAVFGFIENFKKYWRQTFLLLLWGIAPIAIQSEFAKVFTARYILFSIPYLLILAGTATLTFRTFAKKSYVRKYLFPLFVLMVALQALAFHYTLFTNKEEAILPRSERSGYLEEWTAGTGIKEAADFLISESTKFPDTHIVVGTEGYFGTLPDGLQIYTQNLTGVTVIGVGLGINGIHPSLAESKDAGNKTYLLANSSRLDFIGFQNCSAGLDYKDVACEEKIINANGFNVIEKYKKANRPMGMREQIHHGPYDYLYLLEVKGEE